jgi:hypothetical protein
VAFSPGGHTLATTSQVITARLWDTSIDRVTARLCGITPAITHSEWDYYLPGLTYKPPFLWKQQVSPNAMAGLSRAWRHRDVLLSS